MNRSSASPLTAHRRSIRALTGIRFFAALYVVLFHTRVIWMFSGSLRNFFQNGYLAVPLFFLLSGFILAYTYAGQIESGAERRRFWEARFARIWPLYVLSLLLSSLTTNNDPPPPASPTKIVTLFMVQAWDPLNVDLAGAWNFVCWTLSAEAFFYLLFPTIQRWLERRSASQIKLLLAAAILVCIAMNTSMRSQGYEPRIGFYRFLPLALIHLPEFVTGVVLGNIYLRRALNPDLPQSRWLGRGWWTGAAAVASLALLTVPKGPATSAIVPAFAALLFGLAAERSFLQRFLSTPLLVLGGGISYGMYLMQTPVKLGLLRILDRLNVQSVGVRLLIEMLGIVAVAWCLFRFVENPVRERIRDFFAYVERRREHSALSSG